MTPIGLILNLLLGGLLVAALALGIRLDRRLRALRDSQLGFVKAVAELDQAAARTHAGLAQWREATDEARELLHDRIEKAKVQVALLDKLLAEPARVAAPAAEPVATVIREALREAARAPATPSAAPPAAAREIPLRAAAPPQAPSPARSRALIDDDLFEAAPVGAARLQRDLASALGRGS